MDGHVGKKTLVHTYLRIAVCRTFIHLLNLNPTLVPHLYLTTKANPKQPEGHKLIWPRKYTV